MKIRLVYASTMEKPSWHQRLFARIDADERSDRALSLSAGLGPNYVQQLRGMKHSPKLDAAEKLCQALDVSLMWVMLGIEMDAEGEEFIRLAANADPAQRHHLIALLRGAQK